MYCKWSMFDDNKTFISKMGDDHYCLDGVRWLAEKLTVKTNPIRGGQICPLLIDMAFLSGFVRSGLSLLGKESASFPYSVGAKVEWFDEHSIWSLHQGTKKVHNETTSCTRSHTQPNVDLSCLGRWVQRINLYVWLQQTTWQSPVGSQRLQEDENYATSRSIALCGWYRGILKVTYLFKANCSQPSRY